MSMPAGELVKRKNKIRKKMHCHSVYTSCTSKTPAKLSVAYNTAMLSGYFYTPGSVYNLIYDWSFSLSTWDAVTA